MVAPITVCGLTRTERILRGGRFVVFDYLDITRFSLDLPTPLSVCFGERAS